MNNVMDFNSWSRLNESAADANMIIAMIEKGMANGNWMGAGTNEKMIYDAVVGKITDKPTYLAVLAKVKSKGFATIIKFLEQDMGEDAANSFGEYFDPENNRIAGGIERHLKQFNPNEEWGYSGLHGNEPDAGGY